MQPPIVRTILLCAALTSVISACASSETCYEPGTPPDALRTIHIVQRGWHTGVVIPAAEWPNRNWSVLREFRNVGYLEFGWGEERFYQADDTTLWDGSRAALWPSPSVVHVIGLAEPAPLGARANEVVAVKVPADGLRRLTAAIEDEFEGEEPRPNGREVSWAPSPNRFYPAKQSFYFPHLCNWWIAVRLKDAGCPIQPWTVVTASQVMERVRGFRDGGNVVKPESP
jgi:hypothetical protein